MQRQLSYSKSSGDLQMHQSISQPPQNNKDGVRVDHQAVPFAYSKGDGIISSRLICVISGGTVRERDLLSEIERKKSFKQLHAIFVSSTTAPFPQGGLTPRMMKGAYDNILSTGVVTLNDREVHIQDIDKIYLLTDVDHYYDELKDLLARATPQEKEGWIISNPCIEIWIYYCYRNTPTQDLDKVINAKPAQRSIVQKAVNGSFNNGGGLNTKKTFENLQIGIANSKANYAEDANGIPTLLSTQMHRFAEDVILFLGEEYAQWQQTVRERNIHYRKMNP
jgi:hypothetical protein